MEPLGHHPQHYHNAYLYSKQMLCFDPEDQGYLEALKRDLRKLPLLSITLCGWKSSWVTA